MHNLVVFMDFCCPQGEKTSSTCSDCCFSIGLSTCHGTAYNISSKGGKMCLNRFCIDEDAAFELSAVNYLKSSNLDAFKLDA